MGPSFPIRRARRRWGRLERVAGGDVCVGVGGVLSPNVQVYVEREGKKGGETQAVEYQCLVKEDGPCAEGDRKEKEFHWLYYPRQGVSSGRLQPKRSNHDLTARDVSVRVEIVGR